MRVENIRYTIGSGRKTNSPSSVLRPDGAERGLWRTAECNTGQRDTVPTSVIWKRRLLSGVIAGVGEVFGAERESCGSVDGERER